MLTNRSSRAQQERKSRSVLSEARAVDPPMDGNGLLPSGADTLRRIYASLLRCRRVQEYVQASCALPASSYELRIGHEAVTVGATFELSPEDTIAASPRNLAALVATGAPLKVLLARNSGAATAASWCVPILPEDPFNAGTGIALAHRLEKKQRVAVAFCPQQSPTLDTWRDALKFAARQKLPVVFVIENNSATETSAASEAHGVEALSFMVHGCDFPAIIVDGSDAVAVWRVAQEAILRARIGSGPTLIDGRTDPMRDPLTHMEGYLRKCNAWDQAWRRQIEAEIGREIQQAVASSLPVTNSRSAACPMSSSSARTGDLSSTAPIREGETRTSQAGKSHTRQRRRM